MAGVQDYILKVDNKDAEAAEIAAASSRDLTAGRTTLAEVVQSLKDFINHDDATVRSKTLRFLAAVLFELPAKFLSRQQLSVIVDFFCARIQDGGSLQALKQLQSLSRFNDEMVALVMRTLNEQFSEMKKLPQNRRFEVFTLLDSFMRYHRPALLAMGDESLSIILSVSAGEKDPRNLMIVFSIIRIAAVEWDISRQIQTVFENVFCYFPITFKPPPNDPYGITADDLKERLRDCIASNAHLAPHVFPQLVEKLDSTSMNVKRDVIQTIEACALSYKANILSKYSIMLWDSLKFEIIAEQNKEVADATLSAIKSIAKSLGSRNNQSEPNTILSEFLIPVVKESKEHIKEYRLKQGQGASKILHAIGSSSLNAFAYVVTEVIPTIVDSYLKSAYVAERKILLEALLQILTAGHCFEKSQEILNLAVSSQVSAYKDRMLTILHQVVMSSNQAEPSFRVLALKCLQTACAFTQLFDNEAVKTIIRDLDELSLVHEPYPYKGLRDAASEALRDISKTRPNLLLEITLPFLLSKLSSRYTGSHFGSLAAFEALARIGGARNICDTAIRRLFSHVADICGSQDKILETKATLLTLIHILSESRQYLISYKPEYHQNVIQLVRQVALAACNRNHMTTLNETENLSLLGDIACIIVKCANSKQQQLIGSQVYKLYQEDLVFVGNKKLPEQSIAQKRTIFLSTALLAGLNKDVSLPIPSEQIPSLINVLAELAQREDDAFIRHGLHQHLCLLINKFVPDKYLLEISLVKLLVKDGLQDDYRLDNRNVQAIFWVSKALVLRLSSVPEVVKSLLTLLENTKIGAEASQGFKMLLSPDSVVNRENGASVRLLCKQKVISEALTPLMNLSRHANESTKNNCLVAFTGLVTVIETDISLLDIEAASPLLLQVLESGDINARYAILRLVLCILNQTTSALVEHIATLMLCFEKIVADQNASNTELRLLAIRCLSKLCVAFAIPRVRPYQSKAMRIINKALDDPKRLVRKEAVDCRFTWLKSEDDLDGT